MPVQCRDLTYGPRVPTHTFILLSFYTFQGPPAHLRASDVPAPLRRPRQRRPGRQAQGPVAPQAPPPVRGPPQGGGQPVQGEGPKESQLSESESMV